MATYIYIYIYICIIVFWEVLHTLLSLLGCTVILYRKTIYLKQIGEKPEKSEKGPEKSEKSPEKSAADLFFLYNNPNMWLNYCFFFRPAVLICFSFTILYRKTIRGTFLRRLSQGFSRFSQDCSRFSQGFFRFSHNFFRVSHIFLDKLFFYTI